jgi:hypothetical protein
LSCRASKEGEPRRFAFDRFDAARFRLSARRDALRPLILSPLAAGGWPLPWMVGAEGLEPPTYAL